jgi:hypothetical protein
VKRLLFLAGASLLLAACADSPTSPSTGRKIAPAGANHDDDFKCASGYIIAYDEEGNPYCVPDDAGKMASGGGGGSSMMGGPP